MHINKLTIKNFRCFEEQPFTFSVPDGKNEGSGLNIFIGENRNGKTSVLEAISFLAQSRLKTKNTISIKDFFNIKDGIEIVCETNSFDVESAYGKGTFECKGMSFEVKTRDEIKSPNLFEPLVFDNKVIPATEGSAKDYELRMDVTKPWGASRLPPFEFVYFDKNRKRHISKGTFPAKFDDFIDDLNYQIISKIKSLDESKEDEKKHKSRLLSLNDINRKILLKTVSDKILGQVLKDCKSFFDEDIKLDLLNTLEPFLNSFFSARKDETYQQLPISRLGSGVEMIFTLIFLYHFYSGRGKDVVFLIDEPELHLHPSWQDKLINLLMTISKQRQIFVSTHSPYIFKNCIKSKAGFLMFKKGQNGPPEISDARSSGWGKFPWSPSWGEINYFAYNMPTVEFHNELYGYIQDKEKKYPEIDIENFFNSKGISKSKSWIKIDVSGVAGQPYAVTLCTYVRNSIHHPENTHNPRYTESELESSIKLLVSVL